MSSETVIYTFILIKTDDSKYMGWSKAPEKPNDVTGLKWYPWGKELPDDIDSADYILSDGILIKS